MLSSLRPAIQMTIGFGALLVFLGCFQFFAWARLDVLGQRAERSLNKSLIIGAQAGDLKTAVSDVWQWLTDISATRGLDGLNDGFDKAEQSSKTFFMHAAELEQLFAGVNDTGGIQDLENIKERFAAFYSEGKVTEVTRASEEQARGVDQVTAAVSEMEGVTQTSAASAEEISASCEELGAHARVLSGMGVRLVEMI